MRGRAVDLNGNGKPDLVGLLTTFSDGFLAGLFQSAPAPGDGSYQGITGAKLVIAWDGALGGTTALSYYQPPGQPEVVNDYAVGDIDGDGRPEIIATGRGPTLVYSIADDGVSLTLGPSLAIDASDARAVLLTDANGDGALDLAVSSGSQLQIYKGDTKPAVTEITSAP